MPNQVFLELLNQDKEQVIPLGSYGKGTITQAEKVSIGKLLPTLLVGAFSGLLQIEQRRDENWLANLADISELAALIIPQSFRVLPDVAIAGFTLNVAPREGRQSKLMEIAYTISQVAFEQFVDVAVAHGTIHLVGGLAATRVSPARDYHEPAYLLGFAENSIPSLLTTEFTHLVTVKDPLNLPIVYSNIIE